MKKLSLDTKHKTYPIYIGENLLSDDKYILPHLKNNQVLVVSNETVAPLYLDSLKKSLKSIKPATIILKDGEEYKNITTVNVIYDKLIDVKFDRDCTLIALGGGVIGDITGFVASTYMRGVSFIQIPTTLLSQVDSSVGGKTGVNHPKGKNMIGSFWQPECVLSDTNTLKTLNKKQISAGLAEIIKVAIIKDKQFFEKLYNNMDSILSLKQDLIQDVIYQSCKIKADIVAIDETEQGIRALLNLGHTFGHAIETILGYGNILHGEAVGAGIKLAAVYSNKYGKLKDNKKDMIVKILQMAQIPMGMDKNIKVDDYMDVMAVDKKTKNGKINLILINDIADVYIAQDVDKQNLHSFLSQ